MDNLPDPRGWCAPVRSPPVDPFPQHRQLGRGQPRDPGLGVWPRETPALKDLVVEAEALAIPVEQLQPIPLSPPEREDRAAGGFLAQHILGQG